MSWRVDSRRGMRLASHGSRGLPRGPFLVPVVAFWAKCGGRRVARAAAWANGFRCVISVGCGTNALAADQDSARRICVCISRTRGRASMATARKNSKSSTDASALLRGAEGAPPCNRHGSFEPAGSPQRQAVSAPCANPKPRWHACITMQKRYVSFDEEQQAKRRDRARNAGKSAEEIDALDDFVLTLSRFVEIHRDGFEPVRFRINRHKSGHITFTDRRECETGIGGTTGAGARYRRRCRAGWGRLDFGGARRVAHVDAGKLSARPDTDTGADHSRRRRGLRLRRRGHWRRLGRWLAGRWRRRYRAALDAEGQRGSGRRLGRHYPYASGWSHRPRGDPNRLKPRSRSGPWRLGNNG